MAYALYYPRMSPFLKGGFLYRVNGRCRKTGLNTLICKGAAEEIIECCNRVEIDGEVLPMLPEYKEKAKNMVRVHKYQYRGTIWMKSISKYHVNGMQTMLANL